MKLRTQFKLLSIATLVLQFFIGTAAISAPAGPPTEKGKAYFGDMYDPATCTMNAIPCDEPYEGIPKPEPKHDHFSYFQPWSGYCPEATLKDKKKAACMTCQTANLKGGELYDGIEVQGNKWSELVCDEALKGVQAGGGPFGALIIQIDDETNKVIRYWKNHNHVVEWCDPTAHAEMAVMRATCKDLGVMNLGKIVKEDAHLKLPQTCKTSHCEMYTSTEPCPMCYTAMRRCGMSTLVFASTRFDAGVQGIDLPLDANYNELLTSYRDRPARYGVHVYQSNVPNSLDAYNLYKRSEVTKY